MRRVKATAWPTQAKADLVTIGQAVRASRTAQGLSVTALCQMLYVSRQTLINIELGRPGTQADTLLRVMALLNVDLFWDCRFRPANLREHNQDLPYDLLPR